MRRREFLLAVGGGVAAAAPLAAAAQQPDRSYRIAIFGSIPQDRLRNGVFLDELSRKGLIEDQNLLIDWSGMGVSLTSFETVAVEVVKTNPDAIVTFGPAAGHAIQRATQSIPIMAMVDDPTESGLVRSMSNPGGNTTGVGLFASQIDAKRLEIVHELLPTARRIGILVDRASTKSDPQVEATARELGMELVRREVRKTEDIAPAIDMLAAVQVAAIEVQFSALLVAATSLILSHTRALRLPAIYVWPEDARYGWVAVYGPSRHEAERLLAQQLLRVLNGASPADLPFVQPTKFKLVINPSAAKQLISPFPRHSSLVRTR